MGNNSPRSDDLFESSKMSFGGHLDELRTCLVRALVGLGLGFLVSLIFANKLVEVVKYPLENGLKDFYVDRDSMRMQREYNLSTEQRNQLREFMWKHQVTVEVLMMERDELAMLSQLASEPPTSSVDGADAPDPAAMGAVLDNTWWDTPPQLQKVRFWRPLRAKIISLSVPESFIIWVKAALIGGFILSSPWVFVQLWSFVAAGLYPHERRYVYVYIPISVILFLAGVAMAFFVVFKYVLNFLFTFNASMGLEAEPRISEWLGFVLILPVGFGIAFQLPLAMLLLYRIGIFSLEAYLSKWRMAILVIFVISMFLTPADPISMLAMAGPMTFLYFLGIIFCKVMPRTRNPFGEAGYDPGGQPGEGPPPPNIAADADE